MLFRRETNIFITCRVLDIIHKDTYRWWTKILQLKINRKAKCTNSHIHYLPNLNQYFSDTMSTKIEHYKLHKSGIYCTANLLDCIILPEQYVWNALCHNHSFIIQCNYGKMEVELHP